MKIDRKMIISTTLALSVLGTSFNVSASPKKQNYEEWLEKYGAWDILSESYAKMDGSSDLILKRANTLYLLGRYSETLETLQSTPAFSENATEIERLWLGGKALRASGYPDKSFVWFSQAGRLMDSKKLKSSFENEPRFKSFWFDVWRNMYWSFLVTPPNVSEAKKMILEQSLSQASEVWPSTFFINNTSNQWDKKNSNQHTPIINTTNSTFITDKDRILISESLAAASLGSVEEAKLLLEELSNTSAKFFWQSVTQLANDGTMVDDVNFFKDQNLIHPWAFLSSGTLSFALNSDNIWKLPDPSSPAWSAFREKLLKMKPNEALSAIDREAGSLLLSGDIVTALQNYKLAFGLLSGDLDQARSAWTNIDISALPLSLRLAGCIAFKDPFNKLISANESGRKDIYFILSNLCSAAGLEYFPNINSPFWEPIKKSEFDSVINTHPLDRLLLFTELTNFAHKNFDSETARRCAYLFPNSELGAESFIKLANEASEKRDFKLAGFYLNNIDSTRISSKLKLELLVAKSEYEIVIGDADKALTIYNQINKMNGKLDPEKELKLALLVQQKGDKRKAQVILERIWQEHEQLKPDLQAEILFWIAEGEYAMGHRDESLRHYLKLAYNYPEQNIWAVTAMYRSSMIYEMKGQYQTAKNLLKTVIKRADRKSQKEAAKARMDAIDGKMSKNGIDKTPLFPF